MILMSRTINNREFRFYKDCHDNAWMTAKMMSVIFDVEEDVIKAHIPYIISNGVKLNMQISNTYEELYDLESIIRIATNLHLTQGALIRILIYPVTIDDIRNDTNKKRCCQLF
jgi:hypothetical protein